MKRTSFGLSNQNPLVPSLPGSKPGGNTDVNIGRQLISGVQFVQYVFPVNDYDGVSFQLQNENVLRSLTISGTDAVVAASHTWTFANGAFTSADSGGSITVTGATNSNNNSTFLINSVTNGTTIVTNGTQTNETFSNGTVKVTVTSKPLAGAWSIEVSNNWADGQGNTLVNNGLWNHIESSFDTLSAIAGSGVQWTKNSNMEGIALRVTASGTTGNGYVSVYAAGKSRGA